MLLPPVYCDRLTVEPPLTEPSAMARPAKWELPPLTLTPEEMVGCEGVETTRAEPPLVGERKARVLAPMVSAYQVSGDHDCV